MAKHEANFLILNKIRPTIKPETDLVKQRKAAVHLLPHSIPHGTVLDDD
jgi:hypothetical protein